MKRWRFSLLKHQILKIMCRNKANKLAMAFAMANFVCKIYEASNKRQKGTSRRV
jgi:hypothetical protein